MEDIVCKHSWMNFQDNFYLNYNVIDYPKNMYFTANLLSEFLKKYNTLYKKFPYAEKFDISTLSGIDWKTAIITFNKHYRIIIAPEPIKKLINLYKRLDYKKAKNEIFGGFTIPYIQIKSYAIIVLLMIVILFIKICIYFDLFYRFQYF